MAKLVLVCGVDGLQLSQVTPELMPNLAGLAAEGFKPFATIYSTFLQRAYDSVVHDVAIQGLAVRFAMDRAGMVGADGVTHQGSFDIAYLGCLPGR